MHSCTFVVLVFTESAARVEGKQNKNKAAMSAGPPKIKRKWWQKREKQ